MGYFLCVCYFIYLFSFLLFLICRCNSWDQGTFLCVHDLLHVNIVHCCILETMKPSVRLADLVCSALRTPYKTNTVAYYSCNVYLHSFFSYLFHLPPSFCLPSKIIHLCKLVNLVFSLYLNGTNRKYFIYSGVPVLLLLTAPDVIYFQDDIPETSRIVAPF